ncbi:MAG: hypothetical protein BWY15_00510 [Firmicutes bacterium ADurb.Bin193]|nr:MAG: hypothetical protein BWY15_00510 [Firmicutes bacterium ADurb.Bin193]
MKKYQKPTLEIVQIRVSENIANYGNTTTYNLGDPASLSNPQMEILNLGEGSLSE